MILKKGAPQGALFFILLAMVLLTSCSRSGRLSIDTTLRCGAQPEGMALSADGSRLAVACQRSNDVWIHDLKSLEISRIDTLPGPMDLLFDSEGKRLLVAENEADSVAQLDLAEMRITRRFRVLSQPLKMMRIMNGERMLISSLSMPGAGVFRLPGFRPEKSLPMEGIAERFQQSHDGKRLFVVTRERPAFLSFRVSDLSQQLSVLVKGSPVDLALSPDGRFAWVAGEGSFFEQGEEGQEPVPGALTCVRLSDGRVVDWTQLCAAVRSLAVSKSGRYLFIVCGEEGELQVIDTRTFEILDRLSLPGDPANVLLSHDGKRIFVAQRDLKQVSVVYSGSWQ